MEKKTLLRKIYMTRKSRILLSEELKVNHNFYQNLIIYYTVIIICYSLLEITHGFSNSIYILIMSIILSFFTVAVQSQNYLERYLNLKQHYIKLDDLYQRLKNEEDSEEIEIIRIKYIEMLDSVENHNNIHFIKACKNDPDEWSVRTNCFRDHISIILYDWNIKLRKLGLIAVPFLIPLIFNLLDKFLYKS